MVEDTDGQGGAGDGGSKPIVKKAKAAARIVAANRKNQPLEMCVRGRWIRWEPVGAPGSLVPVSREEADDPEFKRLAAVYLNVKEEAK